jgi:hypothetical protein
MPSSAARKARRAEEQQKKMLLELHVKMLEARELKKLQIAREVELATILRDFMSLGDIFNAYDKPIKVKIKNSFVEKHKRTKYDFLPKVNKKPSSCRTPSPSVGRSRRTSAHTANDAIQLAPVTEENLVKVAGSSAFVFGSKKNSSASFEYHSPSALTPSSSDSEKSLSPKPTAGKAPMSSEGTQTHTVATGDDSQHNTTITAEDTTTSDVEPLDVSATEEVEDSATPDETASIDAPHNAEQHSLAAITDGTADVEQAETQCVAAASDDVPESDVDNVDNVEGHPADMSVDEPAEPATDFKESTAAEPDTAQKDECPAENITSDVIPVPGPTVEDGKECGIGEDPAAIESVDPTDEEVATAPTDCISSPEHAHTEETPIAVQEISIPAPGDNTKHEKPEPSVQADHVGNSENIQVPGTLGDDSEDSIYCHEEPSTIEPVDAPMINDVKSSDIPAQGAPASELDDADSIYGPCELLPTVPVETPEMSNVPHEIFASASSKVAMTHTEKADIVITLPAIDQDQVQIEAPGQLSATKEASNQIDYVYDHLSVTDQSEEIDPALKLADQAEAAQHSYQPSPDDANAVEKVVCGFLPLVPEIHGPSKPAVTSIFDDTEVVPTPILPVGFLRLTPVIKLSTSMEAQPETTPLASPSNEQTAQSPPDVEGPIVEAGKETGPSSNLSAEVIDAPTLTLALNVSTIEVHPSPADAGPTMESSKRPSEKVAAPQESRASTMGTNSQGSSSTIRSQASSVDPFTLASRLMIGSFTFTDLLEALDNVGGQAHAWSREEVASAFFDLSNEELTDINMPTLDKPEYINDVLESKSLLRKVRVGTVKLNAFLHLVKFNDQTMATEAALLEAWSAAAQKHDQFRERHAAHLSSTNL